MCPRVVAQFHLLTSSHNLFLVIVFIFSSVYRLFLINLFVIYLFIHLYMHIYIYLFVNWLIRWSNHSFIYFIYLFVGIQIGTRWAEEQADTGKRKENLQDERLKEKARRWRCWRREDGREDDEDDLWYEGGSNSLQECCQWLNHHFKNRLCYREIYT